MEEPLRAGVHSPASLLTAPHAPSRPLHFHLLCHHHRHHPPSPIPSPLNPNTVSRSPVPSTSPPSPPSPALLPRSLLHWHPHLLHFCNCMTVFLIVKPSLGSQTVKNLFANAEDPGSILGSGRALGEGNGNPLQHSCLENPMNGGAWSAI